MAAEGLKLLECPICFFPFGEGEKETPLLLLCGHSFCRSCLTSLVSKEKSEENSGPPKPKSAENREKDGDRNESEKLLMCPMKCQPTPVRNGVLDLKKNFGLVELIGLIRDQTKGSMCEEEDCGASAILFCNECGLRVCQKCDGELHRLKIMKRHTRVPLSEMRGSKKEMCRLHPDQALVLYCVTHSTPICRDCKDPVFEGLHSGDGHTIKPIQGVVREHISQLENSLQELQEQEGALGTRLHGLGELINKVEESGVASQKTIEDTFNELKVATAKAIEERKQDFLNDLQSTQIKRVDKLQRHRSLCAESLASVVASREKIKRVLAQQKTISPTKIVEVTGFSPSSRDLSPVADENDMKLLVVLETNEVLDGLKHQLNCLPLPQEQNCCFFVIGGKGEIVIRGSQREMVNEWNKTSDQLATAFGKEEEGRMVLHQVYAWEPQVFLSLIKKGHPHSRRVKGTVMAKTKQKLEFPTEEIDTDYFLETSY